MSGGEDGPDDAGRDGSGAGGFAPPLQDPWKSFRGVMAGVLVLEVVVLGLGLLVVTTLGGGFTVARAGYVAGLIVLAILGAGLQGRSWAIGYDLVLQALVIAGWWVHPAVGIVGLLFAAVWGYLLYLRADIRERERKGLLPGQRGPRR